MTASLRDRFTASSLNAITAPMRTIIFTCLLLASFACQSGAIDPVKPAAAPADAGSLLEHRNRILAQEDAAEQIRRLMELEKQALQLMVDEPLKLGSIGSAILDIYPASQTGHLVMQRFYEHVESAQAQARHGQTLQNLQQLMREVADGTQETPYPILTIYDAHAFAYSTDATPVGSVYQSSDPVPFGYLLIARPEGEGLQQSYFDLTHLLELWQAQHGADANHDNPWTYIRALAANMDSAAQTSIGAYLASIQKYDDAIGWLQVAVRTDNVLANRMLARIYWTQSLEETDPQQQSELQQLALENHLHAIALGSTDSMYTLANLYLSDVYGEDNRPAGVALLRQAGDLKHAQALVHLGHLHNTGTDVTQDIELAGDYFKRAANLNEPQAVINYGRFLVGSKAEERSDGADYSHIHPMLEELAEENDSQAMVILGNLHARGIGTETSTNRAVRWYKKAVRVDREDADMVNEVAWTLTVSDIADLRRARYAKRIMDHLMQRNEDARSRPEYLDTWAAIHAATGNTERAIELQNEAISAANDQSRDDVLDILQQHLEQFEAGESISERAP